MSLSPFDSFQSRFVTYLLNFPRINNKFILIHKINKKDNENMFNLIIYQVRTIEH